ncbi:50S ribosomal protein L24 [Aquibaculum arenosum]|uniref:Large ribosomal subunit protein uL24 n=1 Tax=Aquibaculum arenosum TaxID=3032591 RepID=A0ABT5YR51_9PROT|nr:50S ribosomal protein L24 [Fodinicurvata sp. CAU 1616]MDF2097256.1 50S ribosomal protein L24 [Fodinicurvata sp. CAU 1616]
MAKQMKIRKGDRVVVLTGKDKGRSGEVLRAIPKEDRVVVQGVNMVTKHQRPTASNQGGIMQIEAPIHVSNVAMADPRDGAPTRIGVKIDGERKLRVARRSGEVIDR